MQRFWDGHTWTSHIYPASPRATAHLSSGHLPQPTTSDDVLLSGWWLRVGAYAIDGALIGGVVFIATIPAYLRMQAAAFDLMRRFDNELSQAETTGNPPNMVAFFRDYLDLFLPVLTWTLLATFIAWMVYGSLMLRFKGATVGKITLGISVRLRDQAGQLPWSAIFVRLLVQQGILLTAPLPLLYFALSWFPYLDNLFPLWDKQRQALHDKAAKTNVVIGPLSR
jgi:uncharacterized RDD family membrane protein YckC